MWEVGGRGPGVEAAEPKIIPSPEEGVSELQQAGADAAPVVSAERLLLDRLPRIIGEYPVGVEGRYEVTAFRAGVPLGGRHIGVTPGEVWYESIPPASIRVAPVEKDQQGAVSDHLPSHPQPVVAVHLTAQRNGEVGGEHEE